MYFVGLEKAFNTVLHEDIVWAMGKKDMHEVFVRAVLTFVSIINVKHQSRIRSDR